MTEFDFSRQRRLLSAGDYRRVFDKADYKVSDQHLLILARQVKTNPEAPASSRLGLVIAKKHVKHAVDRNRIKRIARKTFRTQEPPFEPAIDIVILARKGLGDLDNAALHKVIGKQWRRLQKKLRQSS